MESTKKSPEDQMQVLAQLQRRAEEAEASGARTAKTLRFALIGATTVILTTIIAGGIFLSRYPMDRIIVTDNTKAFCEAQTQGEPLIGPNTVTEFAKDCALDIDTMAYDSIERDLTRAANKCMLPEFRKAFFEASWLADRIKTVETGLYRVKPQTTGPVLITNSGNTSMGYLWRVEVPVKRTYLQGDSPKGANERIYQMDVYRVTKDAFNPVGLGINQITETTQRR